MENTEERKLTPISPTEARKQEVRNITNRFVDEVDRICLDGRVKNITTFEKDLLLTPGTISRFANGKLNVDAYTISRAKKLYNIDIFYVISNHREPELSGSRRAGNRFDIYTPFDRKKLERHSRKEKKEEEPQS